MPFLDVTHISRYQALLVISSAAIPSNLQCSVKIINVSLKRCLVAVVVPAFI